MTSTKDETKPGESWEFDQNVTDAFENMLARSIPGFQEMRRLTRDVAAMHLHPRIAEDKKPTVVDLGCSDGQALEHVTDGLNVQQIGYEISLPMIAAAQSRLPKAQIIEHDLREGIRPIDQTYGVDVMLSILTLQFIGVEYRQRILASIRKAMAKDGIFIIVEKVTGDSPEGDEILTQLYYGFKHAQGYSTEAIERKRLALEGVLSPLTAAENEARLRSAGFKFVEPFWRDRNFIAWACGVR